MIIGRFKARFGSRISGRRLALPPAPASVLAQHPSQSRQRDMAAEQRSPFGFD